MKKILIVTDYYFPHKSGITTYIENLIKILEENNYKITVLTGNYNGKLKNYESRGNVKIIRSKVSFNLSRGFYSFDLIRVFIKESNQADFINIHFPITEIFPLLFLTSKPIYLNYQCLPNSNSLFSKLIHIYFYFFGVITILKSKKVIVLTKDYFFSFFFHKLFNSKIIEILPYINNNSKIKINEKNTQIGNMIRIGFLGRLSEEKGLIDLIKASEIMINKKINHKIKIAGDLKDLRFKRNINNLLKLSTNNSHIQFIGKLKEDEKHSFFENIDVLVLPSINSFEAFGLVQLEAMSYGKPVIASNLYGVRIPIKYTGNGLLYKKGSVEELVQCIVSYKEWKKNMNKTSIIESYNKHFNKEKFSNKFLSLFN